MNCVDSIFLKGILKNKKMPHRPYRRMQGPVQWNAPVSTLRYIGPYFAGILQNQNINSLLDVVLYFLMRTEEAIDTDFPERYLFQKFAELTRNQNAQTCQDGYLPRPINRMAFNALVDLVDYARRHPGEFDNPEYLAPFDLLNFNLAPTLLCRMNEGQGPSQDPQFMCNKVPLMGNVGDEPEITSMRRCPCINNADACNGDCVWSENACISRIADYDNRNYAPDIPPFSGDWYQFNGQVRPGTHYVAAGQNRLGRMFALGPDPYNNESDVDDDGNDNNYSPPPSLPGSSPGSPPGSSPGSSPGSPPGSPPAAAVARVRRPPRGREVTPDRNIQRGSRRPRRSRRLRERGNK
jgi:hypothetical protein